MQKMRILLLLVVFATLHLYTPAQEIITGLPVNTVIEKSSMHISRNAQAQQNALLLPFWDDFSANKGVFPNQEHWSDNYVYINDDYAKNAPTIRVATFDAVNNFGRMYPQASSFAFGADTLTSNDIRLDSLFIGNPRQIYSGDSLYLSFFYQPQGMGLYPSAGDSLLLEFLAPDEDIVNIIPADTVVTGTDTVYIPADTIVIRTWVRQWSSAGESLVNFHNNGQKWFRQVMIPITDSARFFKPDFRFRFRNFASLADATLPDWQSNGDQWNVDYIYLNVDRTVNDTAYADVAFAAKAPSMLSRYTSMPYDHYRKEFISEMADSVSIKIANLGNESYNASYRYEVTTKDTALIKVYNGGNFFIPPYATSGYVTVPEFANPPVIFQYPIASSEPVRFLTTHILNTDGNLGRTSNDTIRHVQYFSNYFSYDDGTAEAGYGVTPAAAQVAYKFQINQNDSLHGAHIYFNQTFGQGNVNSFYFNVWNDNFGKPGELVYSRFGYEPVYTDSLNQFFYYELDSAIMISPALFPGNIFYIGWEQDGGNILNIGYDMNNDASSNIFYNVFNSGWNNTQFNGALMIRPVVGDREVLSIREDDEKTLFSIFPNPARYQKVKIATSIDVSDYKEHMVQIYSPDGRLIRTGILDQELDITGLSNGLYIVQLKNKQRILATEKLIINR